MTRDDRRAGDVLLRTPRLVLRPWGVGDAELSRALWSERDPRVPSHRRLDQDGHPSVTDLQESIRSRESATGGMGLLGLERRAEGDVIGYCGLVPRVGHGTGGAELVFELLRTTWGRGFATEAAEAVLAWARSEGVEVVTASVWEWNTASRRVLEKIGFEELTRTEAAPGAWASLVLGRRL